MRRELTELVREIVDGSFGDVRWMLHTADAQGLYAKIGFADGPPPYPLMERGPGQAPVHKSARAGSPRRKPSRDVESATRGSRQ